VQFEVMRESGHFVDCEALTDNGQIVHCVVLNDIGINVQCEVLPESAHVVGYEVDRFCSVRYCQRVEIL